MSQYATMLLSKVIDANDPAALARLGVTADDMPTKAERAAYQFITDYAAQNRNEAPSYDAVVAAVPDFDYIPNIEADYRYLQREVKGHAAKVAVMEFITGEFTERFNTEKDGAKLTEYLLSEAERIKLRTSVREKVGRTLSDIKDSFRSEYERRKEGKSAKCWQTPFDSLTEEIGGWFSGDVYGIMAESGRGKTYLSIKIVDSLLRQGANVLVKSFEVKEYVYIARLISVITAVDEMFADELGRKVGIPNKQILAGKLDDIVFEKFAEVLDTLDKYYPGTLYFQGKSDSNLTRTLDDLDRELASGQIDAVFLDPFYGLADVYGRNDNKTTGGSAEYAATRFENIIGDNDVVGFYTVQATVDKKQMSEDETRELNLPTREKVKTSKRLLDIATNLLSFDSLEKEGIALLGIEKGRNGGEDFRLELMALFDYGVLKEFESGEAAASQFDF